MQEMWEKRGPSLGQEDPLEEETVTHSSIFAWRIPGTEEPGGLQSMGSRRVGHEWSDLACMHVLEKEMATHSSVLAWRIPGTEKPGGLLSMGLHRVGHDWGDLAAAARSNKIDSRCLFFENYHLVNSSSKFSSSGLSLGAQLFHLDQSQKL